MLARLDDAIAALGDLPVLDRTIVRVRQLAEDPEATTHELVATLESDPALAANVLRFANSAHCAVAVRASTLRQAVTLIGRSNVGRLALEAAVCRFFERAPGNGRASRGALHVHASQVAACAMALAKRAGADAQAAHLGGLLHDLGKLVLPLAFGEDALDALALEHPGRRVLASPAERERLGADHAQAGERFAERAGPRRGRPRRHRGPPRRSRRHLVARRPRPPACRRPTARCASPPAPTPRPACSRPPSAASAWTSPRSTRSSPGCCRAAGSEGSRARLADRVAVARARGARRRADRAC